MTDSLKVKIEKGITFVEIKKILYIEASNKHSIIFCNDSEKIETIHPLKWFEVELDEPFFYRIHVSFIINCHYFKSITNQKVSLRGNLFVPISRHKRQPFEANMEELYKQI